jgi:hypothetical protein
MSAEVTAAPVFRDGSALTPLGPEIHLFLSGGTSRSALGGVGLVHALVDCGRWARVRRIVSVSGGSMLNGALLAGAGGPALGASADDLGAAADDPRPRANALVHRLVRDRLRWYATPVRIAATTALILVVIVSIVVCAAVAGLLPGLGRLSSGGVALVVGLALPAVVITAARWCIRTWFGDVVGVVTGTGAALLADQVPTRQHVFCASGLSSAVPYYFWAGGETPSIPWGEPVQDDYTIVAAAEASGSLPGLGSVRAPQRFRSETLVDGGLSGIFGQQIDDTLQRDPDDAFRGDAQRVCLDAGRHNRADAKLMSRLTSVSLIYTLVRWVKSSLEATYVNDLSDWTDGELLRLSPDTQRATTAGDDEVGAALNQLGAEVGRLGLFNLTADRAAATVAAGYVNAAQWIDEGLTAAAIAERLAEVDRSLDWGPRCAEAWRHACGATRPSMLDRPDKKTKGSTST